METVRLKSSSVGSQVAGIALCLAGAVVLALYSGTSLNPVNLHSSAVHKWKKTPNNQVLWIVGTFLMVLSNVTWSLWMVLQAALLKEYPNKLLVTTAQCVFSTVQSFVIAAVAERDFSRWKLHLDVSLLAVAYTVMMPSIPPSKLKIFPSIYLLKYFSILLLNGAGLIH
jgi:drug/metabolite transporter (DMT)-like permease